MTLSLSPSVMDITGDLDEIEILVEYFNLRQKCTNNLCELIFLQDFPQTDTGPRHIIKYMFDRYKKITRLINKHSNALIAFTFEYRTEDAQIHKVTLSNHMQFRNDILMICYIQHLLFTFKYRNKRCKVMEAMIILMVNKYNVDAYALHFESNAAITFMNISASFLSIYFDIFYNNFANFSDISNLFPDFDLPVMIYAPLIALILPVLNDPPFAILIVISLLMYEICSPHMISNISLIVIYRRIVSFYNSTFPEKMKLHLCKRYNIVILEGDKFELAPSFAQCRQKAKDIISEKKPNDPNLKDILSMI